MSNEEWRPVVGFEGRYEVSSHGRVRGVGPRGRGVRKPYVTAAGYHQYSFYIRRGSSPKNFLAHSLVAEAFLGPRPPRMFACHNDGNPAHNHLSNIRYDTPKSNGEDMVKHGRSCRGTASVQAKMTEAQVAEMVAYRIETGVRYQDVADKFGISKSNVQRIMAGKGWKHVRFDPKADADNKAANCSKKGERGSRSKLFPADVRIICERYTRERPTNGKVAAELAAQYGVHHSSIMSIVRGKAWAHLPGLPTAVAGISQKGAAA